MTEPNNEMELVNETTTIDLEPTTLEATSTLEGDALESNEFEADQEALQTQRIQGIVKKALTQAFAEVKQSAGEFRTITKETLTEVAATMQAEDQSAQNSSDQNSSAPSSSSVKSILAAVFKALKQEFSTFAQRQSVELKQQTSNWDAKLEQQYGDRYTTRKQQAKDAAAWYTKTANQAQTIKPSPFERKQAEMGETFGESGTRFAQKEQQIKQQIKQRLQTLAAKF